LSLARACGTRDLFKIKRAVLKGVFALVVDVEPTIRIGRSKSDFGQKLHTSRGKLI
jgi:hypothetical protein